MSIVGRLHGDLVHTRRVCVLRDRLAGLLPRDARMLDLGCGDGLLSAAITEVRSDVTVAGVDVLARSDAKIPVESFDGRTIPYPTGSFDVVMLVDVVHHADDPERLLREAARVAGRFVLIKDHLLEGVLAEPTLRFMDWVGNAHHGVALPYNYWSRVRWERAFRSLGLKVDAWAENLGLYPRPASWVFERSLHFVARLEP